MITVYQGEGWFRVARGDHETVKAHKKLETRTYTDATDALTVETDQGICDALRRMGGTFPIEIQEGARPRTFAELRCWPWLQQRHYTHCRKCGANAVGHWKYGTRHNVCDDCIDKCAGDLLPDAIRENLRENERATARAQGRAL